MLTSYISLFSEIAANCLTMKFLPIILSLTLFVACNSQPQKREIILPEGKLISCENTLKIVQESSPGYVIIDVRKEKDFMANHIPGAINTWRPDYEDLSNEVKGIMGDKAQMETLLQSWGIKADDTLILYDGKGNSNACRLWWILKQYGFENLRIMDGSYLRWKKLNFPTDALIATPEKGDVKLKELDPKLSADIEDVKNHLTKKGFLLDSRTIKEYEGIVKKGNVKRGGHIPTAVRFDWSEVVGIGGNDDGTFEDSATIAQKLQAINVSQNDNLILYCQSGVRSACVTFVLHEMLGYQNIFNYDGSWLEWGNSELPIEL